MVLLDPALYSPWTKASKSESCPPCTPPYYYGTPYVIERWTEEDRNRKKQIKLTVQRDMTMANERPAIAPRQLWIKSLISMIERVDRADNCKMQYPENSRKLVRHATSTANSSSRCTKFHRRNGGHIFRWSCRWSWLVPVRWWTGQWSSQWGRQSNPDAICTVGADGSLPNHDTTWHSKSKQFVPIFAGEGIEHNVCGEGMRGGFLCKSRDDGR